MTIRLLEGFGGLATADIANRYYKAGAGTPTITNTTPRYASGGSGNYMVGTSTGSAYLWLPASVVWPLRIELAYRRVSASATIHCLAEFLGFYGTGAGTAGAPYYGGLIVSPSGQILLYKKTGANTFVIVATSQQAFLCDYWTHIKILYHPVGLVDGDAAQVQVYVDDELWINFNSALIYNPTAQQQSDVWLRLCGPTEITSSSGSYPLIDDLIVHDNEAGFFGDVQVETIRPDAAGNHTDFTPLAGSNFQNVDETTPDGDTTYNFSSTVNHKDTYRLADLAAASGDIKALMVHITSRTPEACTDTQKIALYDGVTDVDGSDAMSSAQTFIHRREGRITDLGGVNPFNIAGINNLRAGVSRQ
jgi:hypothetical protein